MDVEYNLQTRYGSPRPFRRRMVALVSAVLGVTFISWVLWAGWDFASPDITSQLESYEVVDENLATATLRVTLHNPVNATCKVKAIAEDHTVVGEAALTIPANHRGDLNFEVRTERRATTVDKIGCTTINQERPR
jgi:hypothetical protein